MSANIAIDVNKINLQVLAKIVPIWHLFCTEYTEFWHTEFLVFIFTVNLTLFLVRP